MTSLIRRPVRGPVGSTAASLRQGSRIAAVRLDPPSAVAIHRGVVRVGNDDLVAKLFQATRDPLALRRGLDQDPSPWTIAKDRRESAPLRQDALLDQLPVRRQDADLALILVHVDANMLHGWPPPLRH